jgi:translocation and assembly module TamB
VDEATVGLLITGTARHPRSEIFSEPALAESEAFARLVTGRSLASAGATDAEALERAAIGLGLKRALPTLDRIGENLGLDELGVADPGDAAGAIVAGKQLGEDVYLRYKHGLFDDFAGLELIYRITERFRLRTETGTSQSLDLIYEVDRSRDGDEEDELLSQVE